MNLATKLTLSRILLIPIMLVFYFVNFPYHYLVTAVIFVLASCTDFLDGYVARKRDEVTTLGKFLDPIADKLLVVVVLFMMIGGNFLFMPKIVTIIFACLIMGRELIINAFRLIAVGGGIIIPADKWGKLKTVCLNIAMPLMLCNLHKIISVIGWILYALGTILTILSGINYIVKNKEVLKLK
ncbi:MAG: CDP-diacylglycerol--glycerol-3-phosphate 3-phosphatidyltransferase [Clostridia bacterium]